MVEEMKKYLYLLLGKVDGLLCILISDRDGVPILKVAKNEAPEYAMRPSFISTFGMATDQGKKLGLGPNKSVICIYSTYQVIQINKLPMVITFIASSNSNTGHILSLEDQIDPLLNDLKCAIVEP
ncbi:UNVERIFIED_CONTAM: hypothetical protein PYX00_002922 [Menopon gallinae]|uniref:Ragulator complex protein LAMTOR3 n=1 Tax=Menopon gallinae TaxID=328185 RepID=A0AAW2HYG5_9NEOP